MRRMLISILSATFLASDGIGAIRAVTHDGYFGKSDPWQLRRRREKMNVVTNGGAKVVFVGDSITHFWEVEGKAQLVKYFSEGDRKMLNLGIAADRTEHVLWRLDEGGELDGYEAKCVVLMIGTNNAGHFPFGAEPPSDAILGIREIVRTVRAKQPGAVIVLTAIFPRGGGAHDACRRRNEIVNKEIRKFADGQRIFWCDFNDQFLTPDGRLTPELFPDLLHPNDAGYEIWYSAVKPYVDYALSDRRLPAPANRYASFQRPENVRLDEPVSTCPASRIRAEVPGEGDGWLDRLLRNRNEIAASGGSVDLVLLGDELVQGWEEAGRESLDELRKTFTVLNLGYAGDRTENLLWRGRNGELDGYRAKCVMLMVGANNARHRKDSPEAIFAGVRSILALVDEKQPQAKTLLLPILPPGGGRKRPDRLNSEATNELLKSLADGEKVIWLDLGKSFLDEKGDAKKGMSDRGLPDAAGYREIWMPAVLPRIREICGK